MLRIPHFVSSARLERATLRFGGVRSVRLSYEDVGAFGATRTRSPSLRRRLLCPLSYEGLTRRRGPGLNRRMAELQTATFPLGYLAILKTGLVN